MTEADAQKKLCPIRTILHRGEYPAHEPSGAPFWPGGSFIQHPLCRASDCMLWKWDQNGGSPPSTTSGSCGLSH